jgi:hypothetical protein
MHILKESRQSEDKFWLLKFSQVLFGDQKTRLCRILMRTVDVDL